MSSKAFIQVGAVAAPAMPADMRDTYGDSPRWSCRPGSTSDSRPRESKKMEVACA